MEHVRFLGAPQLYEQELFDIVTHTYSVLQNIQNTIWECK